MNSFIRCAMAATAVVLMLVAFGVAQESRDRAKTKPTPAQPKTSVQKIPQQQTAPSEQVQSAEWQKQADRQLATWLWAESEARIELAKWAIDRTKNEDVKEFAQQVIYDHGEYLEQLRRVGASPLASRNEDEDEADPLTSARNNEYQEKPAEASEKRKVFERFFKFPFSELTLADEPQTSNTRKNNRPMTGPLDVVRVKQEISNQNVMTFKKELRQKPRGEFEKCFIGQQLLSHLMMADTLSVMKEHASDDLRTVIEQGEITANEHLDHVRMLMEEMNAKARFEPIAAND